MIAGPVSGNEVNPLVSKTGDAVESASVISSSTPGAHVSKKGKKTKRKSTEKFKPFLGGKFEEFNLYDTTDFIQFKTQMKIVRMRAQSEDSFWDGPVYTPKTSTKKSKEKSSSKSKNSSVKATPPLPVFKRKISDETISKFMEENEEVRSVKKARAMIKVKEVVDKFLAKHPDIPVEKSHRKISQAAKSESTSEVTNKQVPSPTPTEKTLEKAKKDVAPKPLQEKEEVIKKARQTITPDVQKSSNQPQQMKTPKINRLIEQTPHFSPPKNFQKKLDGGKHSTDINMTQLPTGAQVTKPNGQQIDHVTAINNWIQKNYHNLTTPQKQLVHMQLQYLNNLKKTAFQNSSFVLSPQHLNNLNNLNFLSANFSPFNRNYANFVNVPPYGVDVNQVNQLNLQLLQALRQHQNQQRSFPGSAQPHFNQNPVSPPRGNPTMNNGNMSHQQNQKGPREKRPEG